MAIEIFSLKIGSLTDVLILLLGDGSSLDVLDHGVPGGLPDQVSQVLQLFRFLILRHY